ncbi:hypothetical protein GLOTRDRAFT_134786 [Gloeophyllum trabeum ATCC 11539]|uniref:Uncharacterized protein n=1 Tax=Gloeophyllum trabeum (strain ATCC 11539 / FP-39264 / Madison 617) TaxID=670483 RepID=S7S2M8_GLOTA|nr:uncharacterized protein GLOTRDRAFT_134786 [Gloeophyllum trabeum ATCC 11539]EPQ60019.1 hypothetical protein GLOTRDRAFT_134786 [Gloeophyllum trabeum ATCC 11539]
MAPVSRELSFFQEMYNPLESDAPGNGYSAFQGATEARLVSFYDNSIDDHEADATQPGIGPFEPLAYPSYLYSSSLFPSMTEAYPPSLLYGGIDTPSLSYSDTSSPSSSELSSPVSPNSSLLAAESLSTTPTPVSSTKGGRRPRTRGPVNYRELESDAESEGNGTEDEYRPSPPPQSAKRPGATRTKRTKARARAAPYPSSSNTSSASPASSLSSPSPESTPSQRINNRNHEASCPRPTEIFPDADGTLRCPIEHCKHAIRPKGPRKPRAGDMRRHIATHYPHENEGKWKCRGYPVDVADRRGIPGELHYVDGELYRGGCGKNFSRKDAWRRHLKAGCKGGCK